MPARYPQGDVFFLFIKYAFPPNTHNLSYE